MPGNLSHLSKSTRIFLHVYNPLDYANVCADGRAAGGKAKNSAGDSARVPSEVVVEDSESILKSTPPEVDDQEEEGEREKDLDDPPDDVIPASGTRGVPFVLVRCLGRRRGSSTSSLMPLRLIREGFSAVVACAA